MMDYKKAYENAWRIELQRSYTKQLQEFELKEVKRLCEQKLSYSSGEILKEIMYFKDPNFYAPRRDQRWAEYWEGKWTAILSEVDREIDRRAEERHLYLLKKRKEYLDSQIEDKTNQDYRGTYFYNIFKDEHKEKAPFIFDGMRIDDNGDHPPNEFAKIVFVMQRKLNYIRMNLTITELAKEFVDLFNMRSNAKDFGRSALSAHIKKLQERSGEYESELQHIEEKIKSYLPNVKNVKST